MTPRAAAPYPGKMRFLTAAATAMLSTTALVAQNPPAAPRVDHREVRHDATVIDPYFWLREKTNPKVMEYLKAEDDYAEAMMKPTAESGESATNRMMATTMPTMPIIVYCLLR